MITLPILPLIVSLVGSPLGSPIGTPASDGEPSAVHPHHHKVSVVPCVKGKVTVQWFTVPFNPEQLKKAAKPNYVWNRGFSLATDVPLKCGNVEIAPGRYGMAFQLDAEAANWSFVLVPREITALRRQIRNARRSGDDTTELRKKLDALAKKTLQLPSKTFPGQHAEHMALLALNHGYPIGGRRNRDPIGGVKAELRVSFGDLHTSIAFEEVLTDKAKKAEGAKAGKAKIEKAKVGR